MLIIAIALYLLIYCLTWRRLLRFFHKLDPVSNLYDFIWVCFVCTVCATIAGPIYIAHHVLSDINARLSAVQVDQLVRVLAGESKADRERRLMEEKVERANWISEQERILGIGTTEGEVIE